MKKINLRLIIFTTLAIVLALPPLVLADPNHDNSYVLNRPTDSSNQTKREMLEDKFIANDVIFYDPDQDDCDTTYPDTVASGTYRENVETILKYLTGKGFTLAQAAGIAGNIHYESHFNPLTVEGPSKYNDFRCPDGKGTRRVNALDIINMYPEAREQGAAWYIGKGPLRQYGAPKGSPCGNCGLGLIQWTWNVCKPGETRRGEITDLDRLARSTHRNWYDLGLQMDYLVVTVSGPASNPKYSFAGFLATQTPEDAALYFHNGWVISSGKTIQERKSKARELYDLYRDQIKDGSGYVEKMVIDPDSNTESGSMSSDPCPPTTVSNDLQAAVIQMAWPLVCRKKGKGPTVRSEGGLMCKSNEPLPSYAEAVKRQKANKRYFGGWHCNGQDCGGWVTILLNQSGFEPDYNHPGGAGVWTQYQWVEQSDKWVFLNEPNEKIDVATLQPGDVSFQYPSKGHTFVYVGDIPNFEKKIASAALCSRFPMAGYESLTQGDGGEILRWARKVR